MADYWKSQPRKFCQYCKCWIADNKPSVEFHERGKNHKENVALKISEIKKKSVDKAKQEAKQSKEFAKMEEAAEKAYEEDLRRMEREAKETSWANPAGFPSIVPPGTEVIRKVESQEKPSTPHPGGEEEASSEAAVPLEAEVPEQESQQSKTPKISFRKRKTEAEPSEKDGEDKVSDDAPKVEAEEIKKEKADKSTTAEPEEKKKIEAPARRQAKRPKSANPYGTWEKIKEEVDPYSKVDLQLPKVKGYIAIPSTTADLPKEPKPKFGERIITSLGGEGGPASFRKNKTQNGKSRSLRQRDDDDDD
ncbi:WW domain-binding protein 4 [Liparis tanakae]|uniref:WW domain-binding protein 4 n=1 Tax=Liparis tanakae TaxID=230148 RepID=A0A4Z2GV40_9TELE|nr:WW domain-binding protein 4 [Liparis tanakae]